MLKLKDIAVGAWVMDTSGIYEITEIDERCKTPYTLEEMVPAESDDEWEHSGNMRYLTAYEMKLMEKM